MDKLQLEHLQFPRLNNGAEVRMYVDRGDGTYGVLCYWEDSVFPWVTWVVNPELTDAVWGHYHETQKDGMEEFLERFKYDLNPEAD